MPDPEEQIEDDIGGVQGGEEDAEAARGDGDAPAAGGTVVEAPDSGEIEWAGELVKKAPGAP